MNCTIDWNILTFSEWEQRFSKVFRANLLQSYDYARAVAPILGQTPRWGLVKIDGLEAGLIQIFEASLLKNAIHAVIIDRCGQWFEGFGSNEHNLALFSEINRQLPARIGRKRRIMPEINEDSSVMNDLGYKKISEGYQTIWLDLRPDLDILRANLKKKWRYTLSKAEEAEIEIQWDGEGKLTQWALENYQRDKSAKGYDGASIKTISALAKTFTPRKNMIIGRAQLNGKPIAGVVLLCHGAGATYQLGFSGDAGRKTNAHYLLLWQAIERLKDRGIKDFDLGGINDETAKGIKQFKAGLGGDIIRYAGVYR